MDTEAFERTPEIGELQRRLREAQDALARRDRECQRLQGELDARRVGVAAGRQAEQERAQLYELFMQAPIPITVLRGADLIWEMANPSALAAAGRDIPMGAPVFEAFPELRGQGLEQPALDVLRTGEARMEAERLVRLEMPGQAVQEKWWNLFCAPLRSADGAVDRVLVMSFDVTDQVRARRGAERQREQLEVAGRSKDQFLAMLGHELRNPLSAVCNALLAAVLAPSRSAPMLAIARRQAEQLARIVDDLLDVARITHGRIALRVQRLRLQGVIQRAVDATRTHAEARAHRVSVVLPAHDELQIDADATRIEQVIVNLLSNAIKYSEPGGRIVVSAQRQGSEIALRVQDGGIGIAPDMIDHVFDLFAQASRSLDRAQGGLGIGLTVVKRLVELHGGCIEARSEGLGKGAEFVVRLPAAPGARGAAPLAPSARPRSSEYRRVLVVEDNRDAAESLCLLLQLLGHDPRAVHSGLTALESALETVPDVMLIDIGLPDIDGCEVARRVRRDPRLQRVCLVALTGYGRDEDRESSRAAGFDVHLVKPVALETLRGVFARLGPPGECWGDLG